MLTGVIPAAYLAFFYFVMIVPTFSLIASAVLLKDVITTLPLGTLLR